ncbi:MAG: TetR/AcrR family transcriptional regulator [Melioribacteraceae bacterium]|nr:TetR/AcrR family transcriptional regulator [Melioribacteraceae bacterium]
MQEKFFEWIKNMSMREIILSTTLEMINKDGYDKVKVRDIARRLDISPGNLSYHFNKKEDILFELLRNFSNENNQYYEEFDRSEKTNKNLLKMLKNIFHNQFRFRGIFIGNQLIQRELQENKGFDYSKIAEKRIESFRNILQQLVNHNQLKIDKSEIEFLLSFFSLFNRFWLAEAFLLRKERNENKVIKHYLSVLAKQLSLFSTKKGRDSIDEFLESL